MLPVRLWRSRCLALPMAGRWLGVPAYAPGPSWARFLRKPGIAGRGAAAGGWVSICVGLKPGNPPGAGVLESEGASEAGVLAAGVGISCGEHCSEACGLFPMLGCGAAAVCAGALVSWAGAFRGSSRDDACSLLSKHGCCAAVDVLTWAAGRFSFPTVLLSG